MSEVFINFGKKYKAAIEEIVECVANCFMVDGILVPHCDCSRHGGFIRATVTPATVTP